jgi:hypothetical protein
VRVCLPFEIVTFQVTGGHSHVLYNIKERGAKFWGVSNHSLINLQLLWPTSHTFTVQTMVFNYLKIMDLKNAFSMFFMKLTADGCRETIAGKSTKQRN